MSWVLWWQITLWFAMAVIATILIIVAYDSGRPE